MIGQIISHYRIVEKIVALRARKNSPLVETPSLVLPPACGTLVGDLPSILANKRQ
jgi:hypothetical protein